MNGLVFPGQFVTSALYLDSYALIIKKKVLLLFSFNATELVLHTKAMFNELLFFQTIGNQYCLPLILLL